MKRERTKRFAKPRIAGSADDAQRRAHWKGVYADDDFMAFAVKLRALLEGQHVQLLNAAPFGPQL